MSSFCRHPRRIHITPPRLCCTPNRRSRPPFTAGRVRTKTELRASDFSEATSFLILFFNCDTFIFSFSVFDFLNDSVMLSILRPRFTASFYSLVCHFLRPPQDSFAIQRIDALFWRLLQFLCRIYKTRRFVVKIICTKP